MVEAASDLFKQRHVPVAVFDTGFTDAPGEQQRDSLSGGTQQGAVGVVHHHSSSVVARNDTVAEAGGVSSASGGRQIDPARWSESPFAELLLTDLIRRPPVRELRAIHYGRVREDRERFVGTRVHALHDIRRAAVDAASGVDPDYPQSVDELRRWLCADEAAPQVDDVINAVLSVAGAVVPVKDLRR